MITQPTNYKKLTNCTCGSGLKAEFYCEDETCPLNRQQNLYCRLCSQDERHNHYKCRIDIYCMLDKSKWNRSIEYINQECLKYEDFLNKIDTIPEKHKLSFKNALLYAINDIKQLK